MSIRVKPEPAGARAVLRTALAIRPEHARHIQALTGNPAFARPLPVYTLNARGLGLPHPLRAARIRGWNFLIVGGAGTGIAHLHVSRSGLRFSGITDGAAAECLLAAAVLAEAEANARGRSFEARILDVPAVHLHCLWLYARAGGSRFVRLSSGKHEAMRVIDLATLERHLNAVRELRSARSRQSSDGHRAGREHGNDDP
jgi:hypothetical protein